MRFEPDREGIERVLYGARREFLGETARAALPLMEAEAPVSPEPRASDGSGVRLRDNHKVAGPDADASVIWITNDKPFTAPVHEGAKPHLIPNAFGRGFTVEHPGNSGNPWMRRALDRLAQTRTT